jgi:guanylate kinase
VGAGAWQLLRHIGKRHRSGLAGRPGRAPGDRLAGCATGRRQFPAASGIFIVPPSIDELGRRLRERATDSDETIARRVAAAREEMRHVDEFDYVIINDDLQRALHDLLAVVRATRLRYAAQRQRHSILFATML